MKKVPRFETIPAKRSHCAEIACSMRGDHIDALSVLGLDPFHEIVEAFNQSPRPLEWWVDDKLGALGGIAAAPLLCPIGIAWLVVSEHGVRFARALVRELRRELDGALQMYPILAAALCPADKKSLRFAAHLGFAVEHAYPQDGLLIAVYGKGLEYWKKRNE
jgi:hypothetical protein